ncbi:MAG: thioether cross-link-forming SCIFF peptide maturase [Clostridiales bacterium]|jgi:uncharacterized protein|nr:thioether cross-link-forming SCIFF peptide maturase [Clostridiales bacterium]
MVHTFGCLGRYFALDSESGSLFEVDETAKQIIDSRNSSFADAEGSFFAERETDARAERKPNAYAETETRLNACAVGEFKARTDAEQTAYAETKICPQTERQVRTDAQQTAYAETEAEIEALISEGALFSRGSAAAPRAYGGVIKSMCLNVSHRCNLRCAYCFAGGGSYGSDAENMSFDVAKRAVDFLVQNSGARKVLEVDFFGGEPTLNLDVVQKTVEYARGLERPLNKTFRFTVTTNAYALSDAAADFFNGEMHNVVISIDGRKDVHNRVRKTAAGGGSFDNALKNAAKFRRLRGDKQYYVRGTYTRQNLDFAADALALVDYGFDKISLEPVVLPDSHPLALRFDDLPALFGQYELLAAEYLKRLGTDGEFLFFHFNVDLAGGPCEDKRLRSCGAGCEYVAVTPSGDVYPCHQFALDAEFRLGDVFSGRLDSAVQGRLWSNDVTNKPHCQGCFAKYFCSGGCAANSRNLAGGIERQHKISCELMRKRIECALAITSIK